MGNQNRRQQERQGGGSSSAAMMNFYGYAPAGWRRSDAFIEDDICVRLGQDRGLDASGIQVEVHDGNVVMSGYVPTMRNRQQANSIVLSVYGIKHLANNLEIGIAASAGGPASTMTAGKTRA